MENTAKGKAEELIHNFENVDFLKDVGSMDIELARQCAIVCVEKLILNTDMYFGNINPKWSFWEEVKQELEKMLSMKTKFEYFSIGNELFWNNGNLFIHVCNDREFPKIEFLEQYNIAYYNKHWRKHMAQINKEIFEKQFEEVSEIMKEKLLNK